MLETEKPDSPKNTDSAPVSSLGQVRNPVRKKLYCNPVKSCFLGKIFRRPLTRRCAPPSPPRGRGQGFIGFGCGRKAAL